MQSWSSKNIRFRTATYHDQMNNFTGRSKWRGTLEPKFVKHYIPTQKPLNLVAKFDTLTDQSGSSIRIDHPTPTLPLWAGGGSKPKIIHTHNICIPTVRSAEFYNIILSRWLTTTRRHPTPIFK